MSDKKYKVIVSDRAKRMLGTHIRFMAQVNKDAAKAKKKEFMDAMLSFICGTVNTDSLKSGWAVISSLRKVQKV